MGAPPVGERQRFAETDRPRWIKDTRWALLKDRTLFPTLSSRSCTRCAGIGPRSTDAGSSRRALRDLVGVRNSDQELDLRLRNAAAQTCQHLSRRHGRGHPAIGCLALGARACGASRAGPECVRL
jgi:hypothetical protein